MASIGSRIKDLRLKQSHTLESVANGCGITVRAVSYYERGEREPAAAVLVKLCQFFNVSADYLLGLSDEPNIKN